MDVTIGDIYTRHSDGKPWKLKNVDKKKVVLESLGGAGLTVTDIFGLEKGYTKKVRKAIQSTQ